MNTESTNSNFVAAQISDDELAGVAGGYNLTYDEATGKYYAWEGSDTNTKYVCPKCGRPLKAGFMNFKFYCDPCDESWFFEGKLNPNLNGGWKEISKDEYDSRQAPIRYD